MDELANSLRTDRFIKIFVSNESEPFLVRQSTLESTSEYIRGALRNEHLGDGERGTPRYPDDNLAAWKVLLYWITRHELYPDLKGLSDPDGTQYDDFHRLCIRCWALGDKYGIAEFQHLIMPELLDDTEGNYVSMATMREAFDSTATGSPLRELMAEQIALRLRLKTTKHGELDLFDGVVGFISELAKKLDTKSERHGYSFLPRVPRDDEPFEGIRRTISSWLVAKHRSSIGSTRGSGTSAGSAAATVNSCWYLGWYLLRDAHEYM